MLAPALLAVAVAGCSDDSTSSPDPSDVICTQVGCTDGAVRVEAPSGTDGMLTVCVDGDCKEAPLVGSTGELDFPGMDPGTKARATLVMADGSRWEGEAPTVTMQPNGPNCPPTCVIANITLSPATT